ncbi:phosphatase YcdX [Candidatus Lokiarchaeum ossiferum]|uniref:histidinol-phosphatase n=1 Tax=Candidatus Lokiarchaeum ossiferum TaxID=2951803 RepID=A0ABY6HYT7_9ARCH|nr:phosphatase YcdX [Candidatus Lokiarchaeum sp. B-35]
MKFWDNHTHNYLCNHAKGTVEEYVISAIEKNLCEIGLSDHFPMHLISKEANVEQWAMRMEQFPKYIASCQQVQKKYQDKIIVKVASEVDFTPKSFSNYKIALEPFLDDLDYIIGSVHVIDIDGVGERAVDSPDSFSLMEEVGSNIIYKKYYETNIKMVKTGFYNIVGHCDLPKKFGILPNEEIWEYTLKFLDAVEESDMAIEINHAGFCKPVATQYPDDKIIHEVINRNIPITFGSDAHESRYVGYGFEETYNKLMKYCKKQTSQLVFAKFNKRNIYFQ